tara:strand:+ start:260 stop:2155 length:1896 start_codon:yes stop_codon:yes gene_type:complete
MSSHSIMKIKPRKRIEGVERWFLDIETWGLNARNYAFCVLKNWKGDIQKVFYDLSEAKDFLHTRPTNVIVYAHNCWKFDGLAFYDVKELIHADRLATGTRIISMTIETESGIKIEWRDTVAILPLSVSALGDSLGLPKGETPIDYIKGRRRAVTPLDVEYCVRDVEILRQSVIQLDNSFNEWCDAPPETYELPPTSASMAYRIWCHNFWPSRWISKTKRRSRGKKTFGEVLLDEHGNPKTTTSFRAFCNIRANETLGFAFYGGRTQVITQPGLLHEWVHSVDANSLYPSVMLNDYPNMATCRQLAPILQNLNNILSDSNRLCWAHITLKGGVNSPVFLPNTTEDGRRQWDSKEFDGWLCEPEIKHALKSGYEIIEIKELHYASVMRPFDEYVNKFYNLRREYQKNNDSRELLCKLLLNALFGRFGMKDICERIDQPEKVAEILEGDDWLETHKLQFYDGPNGEFAYLEGFEPTRKSNSTWFGFAAFCTSYGRVELQKVIEAAGSAACYTDTDSVHFTVDGYDRVMKEIDIGPELGQWKFETPPDGIPFCRWWEPKAYVQYDENMARLKVKHKGVSIYDDEGNLKPEAGDLTQPQTYLSVVQFYTSLRRGLELGTELLMTKRSHRWCGGEET